MDPIIPLFILSGISFYFSLKHGDSWKNFDKSIYKFAQGKTTTKMIYSKHDFTDYTIMLVLSQMLLICIFGQEHIFSQAGFFIAGFLFFMFILRRGVSIKYPHIFNLPELFRLMVYKFTNFRLMVAYQIASLFVEQIIIRVTPQLPHYKDEVQQMSLYLFYLSFIVITIFRTIILFCHLFNATHVLEFLQKTGWKKVMGSTTPAAIFDIFHGYCTGVLSHIFVVANWFLVIHYFEHSLLLLPFRVYICHKLYIKFEDEDLNSWYYRDHWLGHHSAIDFIYLHGPHHDAIPISLISAAETGPLEALMRHIMGHPESYTPPLYAFYIFTKTLIRVMVGHQYVPGIFPYSASIIQYGVHHVEHHYLQMRPLANGIDPKKCKSSSHDTTIDTTLDSYNPENATWKWFCEQVKLIEGYSED